MTKAPQFAATTKVSSDASQVEIKRLVQRYGAREFMAYEGDDHAVIIFVMKGRRIRFNLPLPHREDKQFTSHSRGARTEIASRAAWEQACRQKWRALLLSIKAKLESIESGIESFDEAFLAHVVLPDGSMFGHRAIDAISIAYEGRPLPPLLPAPKE